MKTKIVSMLFIMLGLGLSSVWAAPVESPEIPFGLMPFVIMGTVGLVLGLKKLFEK